MELKRLKSGTDVRGVADTDLTDEVVSAIAMAFAVVLKREKADVRIAVDTIRGCRANASPKRSSTRCGRPAAKFTIAA